MKTYEQLMTHYWGVIVPMAEAAGINPWECVRTRTGYVLHNHPQFNNKDPENYTFALTVLEKRPVFVGDKLYANNCTQPLTIKGNSKQFGYLSVGECTNYHIDILSWTPPTPKVTPKKRTFMLGDKELPCPDKNKGGYQIALISSKHFFSDFHDAQKVANAIDEILTTIDLERCDGELIPSEDKYYMTFYTTTPNWNIPNAEYSFTEFKD